MSPIERCQQEQRECAAHLAKHGRCDCQECIGARLGLADNAMEEVLLMVDDGGFAE